MILKTEGSPAMLNFSPEVSTIKSLRQELLLSATSQSIGFTLVKPSVTTISLTRSSASAL